MAKISRNTFDDNKNYKQVIEQIGVPVVDNEINELQDILLTEAVENGAAAMSVLRATEPGAVGPRPGYSRQADWAMEGAVSTVDINVRSGTLWVDGYRITLSANTSVAAQGVTFPGTVGADTYGFIYMDVVLTEIDSTVDTNIAQSQVGETTRRKKLSTTFGKTESTVSWEAAYTALTALTGSSGNRIWKNNVARVFLCRYKRPSGSTNILSSYVVDLRQAMPGERQNWQPFIKTIRPNTSVAAESSGISDAMITWDLTNSKLQIGVANGAASADSLESGLRISLRGSTNTHYVSQGTGQVWAATGAGNADGTPRTPDITKGWTLSDGQVLGYVTEGNTSFRGRTAMLSKGNSGLFDFYDYDPTPVNFTPDLIQVQKLIAGNIGIFNADPGCFILVRRLGNDLIWYDGSVTRGHTGRNVFHELGGTPSIYTAVVGSEGINHAGLIDGVERVLDYSATGTGTGNLGTIRAVRVHVRRGAYEFARKIRKYGLVAEFSQFSDTYDADSNKIELTGDGPESTKLTFRNPEASIRTLTDTGVLELAARTIVLRGLTLDQLHDSTFKGSYYEFYGGKVVLEDCHFTGPVYIEADEIVVRNCRFNALGNTYDLFPTQAGNLTSIAQHLFLATPNNLAAPGAGRWEVSNNLFVLGRSDGTQGGLIINSASSTGYTLIVDVHNNVFHYPDTNGKVPAIHVPYHGGFIEIHKNKFSGARGVVKAGNVVGDTTPFNGNYNGAPILKGVNNNQFYALGYISCTHERHPGYSGLSVHHNHFSMTDVSNGVSGRFVVWGAFMYVFNYLSNGSSGFMRTGNVSYCHNVHEMGTDFGTGWGAGGADPQPWIAGFYMAPTWQDGASITDLLVDDLEVCHNTFYMGGPTTAKIWRGIQAPDMAAWPGSGGFMTDSSHLIAVVLKNSSAAIGGFSYDGRSAQNVLIAHNRISQRLPAGGSAPSKDLISIDDAAHPRWNMVPIVVDFAQHPFVTNTTPGVDGGAPFGLTTGEVILSCIIEANRVELPIYQRSGGSGSLNLVGIKLIGGFACVVAKNAVYLSTSNGSHGTACSSTIQTHIFGNTLKANVGASQTASDFVSGNVFKGCVTNTSGGVIQYNQAAPAAGDNFT